MEGKDHRDSFYDRLDEVLGINDGWKEYIDDLREKNKVSNDRLYRLLMAIKGSDFSRDVRSMMRIVGWYHQIRISRIPSGTKLPDKRWKNIRWIWADVKPNQDGALSGYLYVQVKQDRFLKILCTF